MGCGEENKAESEIFCATSTLKIEAAWNSVTCICRKIRHESDIVMQSHYCVSSSKLCKHIEGVDQKLHAFQTLAVGRNEP
jgi:hypothetical protein